MEIPSELKPDLHKALLGPLSMAAEIYGALLPGCIFILLLVLKGNSAVSRAFSYPFLGYKTKIACVLLAAYFVGKVAMVMAGWCEEAVLPKKRRLDSALLKEMPEEFFSFLGGLACSSILSGKSPLIEHFAGYKAHVAFFLSSGLILLAAAAIPGDGNFRFAEAVAGVVFVTTGVRAARKEAGVLAGIFGAAAGNVLSGVPVDKWLSGGLTILEVWTVVSAALKKSERSLKIETPPNPSGTSSSSSTETTAATPSKPGDAAA